MGSSVSRGVARVQAVAIIGDVITVKLTDSRSIPAPLVWYPRLLHGTPEERSNWRLIGPGHRHPLALTRRGHQRAESSRRLRDLEAVCREFDERGEADVESGSVYESASSCCATCVVTAHASSRRRQSLLVAQPYAELVQRSPELACRMVND